MNGVHNNKDFIVSSHNLEFLFVAVIKIACIVVFCINTKFNILRTSDWKLSFERLVCFFKWSDIATIKLE